MLIPNRIKFALAQLRAVIAADKEFTKNKKFLLSSFIMLKFIAYDLPCLFVLDRLKVTNPYIDYVRLPRFFARFGFDSIKELFSSNIPNNGKFRAAKDYKGVYPYIPARLEFVGAQLIAVVKAKTTGQEDDISILANSLLLIYIVLKFIAYDLPCLFVLDHLKITNPYIDCVRLPGFFGSMGLTSIQALFSLKSMDYPKPSNKILHIAQEFNSVYSFPASLIPSRITMIYNELADLFNQKKYLSIVPMFFKCVIWDFVLCLFVLDRLSITEPDHDKLHQISQTGELPNTWVEINHYARKFGYDRRFFLTKSERVEINQYYDTKLSIGEISVDSLETMKAYSNFFPMFYWPFGINSRIRKAIQKLIKENDSITDLQLQNLTEVVNNSSKYFYFPRSIKSEFQRNYANKINTLIRLDNEDITESQLMILTKVVNNASKNPYFRKSIKSEFEKNKMFLMLSKLFHGDNFSSEEVVKLISGKDKRQNMVLLQQWVLKEIKRDDFSLEDVVRLSKLQSTIIPDEGLRLIHDFISKDIGNKIGNGSFSLDDVVRLSKIKPFMITAEVMALLQSWISNKINQGSLGLDDLRSLSKLGSSFMTGEMRTKLYKCIVANLLSFNVNNFDNCVSNLSFENVMTLSNDPLITTSKQGLDLLHQWISEQIKQDMSAIIRVFEIVDNLFKSDPLTLDSRYSWEVLNCRKDIVKTILNPLNTITNDTALLDKFKDKGKLNDSFREELECSSRGIYILKKLGVNVEEYNTEYHRQRHRFTPMHSHHDSFTAAIQLVGENHGELMTQFKNLLSGVEEKRIRALSDSAEKIDYFGQDDFSRIRESLKDLSEWPKENFIEIKGDKSREKKGDESTRQRSIRITRLDEESGFLIVKSHKGDYYEGFEGNVAKKQALFIHDNGQLERRTVMAKRLDPRGLDLLCGDKPAQYSPCYFVSKNAYYMPYHGEIYQSESPPDNDQFIGLLSQLVAMHKNKPPLVCLDWGIEKKGSQWKGHNVCEKDGKLTLIDLTLASESYDVGSISIKDQEFWVDNPEHVRKHPKMLDLFMFLDAVKDCCKSESSKYSQLQTQVSSFLCEKQGSVDENELYKEICNQLFAQLGVKRKERVSYEKNASKHLLLHSIEPIEKARAAHLKDAEEKARAAHLKDAEAGFGGPGLM